MAHGKNAAKRGATKELWKRWTHSKSGLYISKWAKRYYHRVVRHEARAELVREARVIRDRSI